MILAIATGGGQGRERQGYSDDAGWSVEIGIYRNVHMCRRTYVRIRAHARYLLVNDIGRRYPCSDWSVWIAPRSGAIQIDQSEHG